MTEQPQNAANNQEVISGNKNLLSFFNPSTLEMIKQPQERIKKFVAVTLSNKKRKQLKSRLVKVFKLIALVVEMNQNTSKIDGHTC